jgi:hypothetical protein
MRLLLSCDREGGAVATPLVSGGTLTRMTLRLLIVPMCAVLIAGCAGEPGTASPVYDPNTRELVRIDYDYDDNGVVDVKTYMQNGKPARLEGDANGDGKTDRWEYYDSAGRLDRVGGSSQQDGLEDTWIFVDGRDTRMEVSTARNGRVDRREFYRDDVLVRTESDTNGDDRPDTWETFRDGRLAVIAIDEGKTSGRPTKQVVYADGAVRVEIDPDGDGRFAAPCVGPGCPAAPASSRPTNR